MNLTKIAKDSAVVAGISGLLLTVTFATVIISLIGLIFSFT